MLFRSRLSVYGYPDIPGELPEERTLTAGRSTVGRKRVENLRRNVRPRLIGVRFTGRPPKTYAETYADGSPIDGSTTGWFPPLQDPFHITDSSHYRMVPTINGVVFLRVGKPW